jgi:hypothetical protein
MGVAYDGFTTPVEDSERATPPAHVGHKFLDSAVYRRLSTGGRNTGTPRAKRSPD